MLSDSEPKPPLSKNLGETEGKKAFLLQLVNWSLWIAYGLAIAEVLEKGFHVNGNALSHYLSVGRELFSVGLWYFAIAWLTKQVSRNTLWPRVLTVIACPLLAYQWQLALGVPLEKGSFRFFELAQVSLISIAAILFLIKTVLDFSKQYRGKIK